QRWQQEISTAKSKRTPPLSTARRPSFAPTLTLIVYFDQMLSRSGQITGNTGVSRTGPPSGNQMSTQPTTRPEFVDECVAQLSLRAHCQARDSTILAT